MGLGSEARRPWACLRDREKGVCSEHCESGGERESETRLPGTCQSLADAKMHMLPYRLPGTRDLCRHLQCSMNSLSLILQRASESPGELVETQTAGPHYQRSDFILWGVSLRICISNKFPKDLADCWSGYHTVRATF